MNLYEITWQRVSGSNRGDWLYRREYKEDLHDAASYGLEFTNNYIFGKIRLQRIEVLEYDVKLSTGTKLTRDQAIDLVNKYNTVTWGVPYQRLDLTDEQRTYVWDLVLQSSDNVSVYDMVVKIAEGKV